MSFVSNNSYPILIIGAGVAGTVVAIGLQQKGYKVILFEKYNGPGRTLHHLFLSEIAFV